MTEGLGEAAAELVAFILINLSDGEAVIHKSNSLAVLMVSLISYW